MIPFGPICVLACMVWLVAHYWLKLFRRDHEYGARWFISWGVRGLVLPLAAWILLNSGSHPAMPAFARPAPPAQASAQTLLTQIAAARQAATQTNSILSQPAGQPPPPGFIERLVNGVEYVARQSRAAIVVASSYWAALTIGWFVIVKLRRIEDRKAYVTSCIMWCVLVSPFLGLMIYLFGLGGLGFTGLLCVWPLMHQSSLMEPGRDEDPVLSYGRAVAGLKLGKYKEAEAAIIAELEKSETDFDGWMMLAELYALQFNDLGEAERTVVSVCSETSTTLPQVSVALHRLADWHLQLGDDPLSARRALDEIRRRMPNTHLARMAALRIDRLPLSGDELRAQRTTRTIRLPALGDTIDEAAETKVTGGQTDEPLAQANRLVERLKHDPNDTLSRERLARIFAEQLGQVDLAIEQIELLMDMPEQPTNNIAAWLGLMAAWQIRYRGNRAEGRRLLERLVREHPQTVQAFAAQRRLNLLEMEDRAQAAPPPPVRGELRIRTGPDSDASGVEKIPWTAKQTL